MLNNKESLTEDGGDEASSAIIYSIIDNQSRNFNQFYKRGQ
jgi:hypothetical protein